MRDGPFRQWYINFASSAVGQFNETAIGACNRPPGSKASDHPRSCHPQWGDACDRWKSLPLVAIPALVLGTSPYLDIAGLQDGVRMPTIGVNGIVRVFTPDVWFVATCHAWLENKRYRKLARTIIANCQAWHPRMRRAGVIPLAFSMLPIPTPCLQSSAVCCAWLLHFLGFCPVYLHGMDAEYDGARSNFHERDSRIELAGAGVIRHATIQLLQERWTRSVRRIADLPPVNVPHGEIEFRMSRYIRFVRDME